MEASASLQHCMAPEVARSLTEEVKADAAALWTKLLRLYEGGAHTALGYSSWGDYCRDEFDFGKSQAYRILDAARVVDAVPQLGNAPEAVARELVPVLREQPEAVEEVWGEVVELHGDRPTAGQVREFLNNEATWSPELKAALRREPHSGMAVHYSSQTDEWATPQDLFDALDREFGFDLDVCALTSSAKCDRYFTPETDGLAQEWTGTCWMNPPYGRDIGLWVAKAHLTAAVDGATVVCLVPARVDTGWWWENCRYGEVRFLRGRLRFGDADSGAPFPSAVVVFRPGAEPSTSYWEWK